MSNPSMTYRPLGTTGINVSLVSLGTGGQSRLGQTTHKDESESIRLVRRALDLGINLIDTAPGYMDSEEILGRALEGVPRDRYVLATKVGHSNRDGLISPADLTASLEESLRRLRTDYVDGLQFHGVNLEIYDQLMEALYPTVEALKQAGKIRFCGVTEFMEGRNTPKGGDPGHEMATHAARDGRWDAVGIKYGILNQSADRELFPAVIEDGVGLLNMSAVRVKLVRPLELEELIAEWKRQELLGEDDLPEQDPLGFLVHHDVPSVIAAAYRFAAEPEAVSSVVVGTGNVAHLEENVDAILRGPLHAEDSRWLRMLFGHITEGV
jgi:aryl-alcohol dehydrogenase-like predicted oxidoreductase